MRLKNTISQIDLYIKLQSCRSCVLLAGVFLVRRNSEFRYPAALGVGRFAKIGIPAPQVMAPFVGSVDIVFGALILTELLTRLASFPLLITIERRTPHHQSPVSSQTRVFWAALQRSRGGHQHAWLGLIFLLIVGAGSISLDARLSRRAATRVLSDFRLCRRKFLHGNFFYRAAHPNPLRCCFASFFLLLVFGMFVRLCRSSLTSQPSQLNAKRTIAAALRSGADRDRGLGRGIVRCIRSLSVVSRYSRRRSQTWRIIRQALLKSSPTDAGLAFGWALERKSTLPGSPGHRHHHGSLGPYSAYGQSIRQHRDAEAVHGLRRCCAFDGNDCGLFGAMSNKHAPVRGGAIDQFLQESR